MKRLLLLLPLLLVACSTGSKIKQLSCTYEQVVGDTYGDAPKAEDFIFDTLTGEAFEYSDFYEKLKSIEGKTTLDGYTHTFNSTIVNDVLKRDSSVKENNPFDLEDGPDIYKHRINLKDMTVELEYKSGISELVYKAVGSCEYTEPQTVEIHQDK